MQVNINKAVTCNNVKNSILNKINNNCQKLKYLINDVINCKRIDIKSLEQVQTNIFTVTISDRDDQ